MCNNNSEISCELKLEIIISIYKEAIYQNKNKELENIREDILKKNKIKNLFNHKQYTSFNYRFMKINNEYIPNLEVIKLSGLISKNYYSSILIFEACIENLKLGATKDDDESEVNKSKKNMRKKIAKKTFGSDSDTEEEITLLSQVNNILRNDIIMNKRTKIIWVYLLQFYSKIKNKR